MNIVTNAYKEDKQLFLEFKTNDVITDSDFVTIVFNGISDFFDGEKPFEVIKVRIKNGLLVGTCKEAGYWAEKISRRENLDLRELIGLPVTKVTDVEDINIIIENSLLC
tara:strand:+ start:274 stop:600 length:327 start_codon:yes stop_codon:yes gene_type:complete